MTTMEEMAELSRELDDAAEEIERLCAENERLRAAVAAFQAWLDHDRSLTVYPPGTTRDTPGNEAIWRTWWDHGLDLWARAEDLARAALEPQP